MRPYVIKVYGKDRLMTTALCVKKNINKCDKKRNFVTISDRKGRKLKVYTDCFYCGDISRRNAVYNDEATFVSIDDAAKAVDLNGVLYSFTDEDEDEIKGFLEGEEGYPGNLGHRYQPVD